ncbi:MAG: hypothetical protein RBR20_00265 [Desulfobacterales bacterium]|jgi:hypothetical protein|nr:hypothetical protein [Desulfobacteraceae bacterium]MDD3990772.1 hypothetical protein [Desulfobacteraceae bacterium]MDY0310537.1 hypothetical protein [Desulfobacterales bacterium]
MTQHGADEIRYEPEPGFRRAFHLILAVTVAYLAVIFTKVWIG